MKFSSIYWPLWQDEKHSLQISFVIKKKTRVKNGCLLTNSVAPEPEGSSPYSQEPATGPYPEPTGSNLHSSSQSPQDPF
jgi:hypothetical protein